MKMGKKTSKTFVHDPKRPRIRNERLPPFAIRVVKFLLEISLQISRSQEAHWISQSQSHDYLPTSMSQQILNAGFAIWAFFATFSSPTSAATTTAHALLFQMPKTAESHDRKRQTQAYVASVVEWRTLSQNKQPECFVPSLLTVMSECTTTITKQKARTWVGCAPCGNRLRRF